MSNRFRVPARVLNVTLVLAVECENKAKSQLTAELLKIGGRTVV